MSIMVNSLHLSLLPLEVLLQMLQYSTRVLLAVRHQKLLHIYCAGLDVVFPFPFYVYCEIEKCARKKDVEVELLSEVKSQIPTDCLRLLEAAAERGASTWLTALSLKELWF